MLVCSANCSCSTVFEPKRLHEVDRTTLSVKFGSCLLATRTCPTAAANIRPDNGWDKLRSYRTESIAARRHFCVPQATKCGRRDAVPWVRLLCPSSRYLVHVLLLAMTPIMKPFPCTSLGSKYCMAFRVLQFCNVLPFALVVTDTLIVWYRNAR